MPKSIIYLEALRVQITATEVDEFVELLLQSFLDRIPVQGWTREHYFAFKEAAAVMIRGMQRPRLVLDAEQDFLDQAISHFRWVELPGPTGISSLTTLTAAKQQNPCITCEETKLPICTCVL